MTHKARIATVLLTDDPAYDEVIPHIPGAMILNSTEITSDSAELRPYTDALAGDETPELPMNEDQAHALVNDEGYIHVSLPFDLDSLEDVNPDSDEESVYNLLHNAAFSFGFPIDCSWRVLGVLDDSNMVLVEYTFGWNEYRAAIEPDEFDA